MVGEARRRQATLLEEARGQIVSHAPPRGEV